MLTRLVVVGLVLFSGGGTPAQEPSLEENAKASKEKFKELVQLVPQFEITTESNEKFDLIEKPILRWSLGHLAAETARKSGVYLWTYKDRPAALVCPYWAKWMGDSTVEYEFTSLHDQGFSARALDRTMWTPRQPGVNFEVLTTGPKVAERRTLRLAQMRGIARKYDAFLGPVDAPKTPLELLSQPLYRYDEKIAAPGVIDGALFTWADRKVGDPTILLLVEARQAKPRDKETPQELQWHIAFARAGHESFVKEDKKVVWSCERHFATTNVESTYYWINFDMAGLDEKPKLRYKP